MLHTGFGEGKRRPGRWVESVDTWEGAQDAASQTTGSDKAHFKHFAQKSVLRPFDIPAFQSIPLSEPHSKAAPASRIPQPTFIRPF